MSAVAAHAEWIDGWNAGLAAAEAVVTTSGLPADITDHVVKLIHELMTD